MVTSRDSTVIPYESECEYAPYANCLCMTNVLPLGVVAILEMAVWDMSWSRNWPNCMTISVLVWWGMSTSSWISLLTLRARGRGLP